MVFSNHGNGKVGKDGIFEVFGDYCDERMEDKEIEMIQLKV
jgi:hypothetical protein